MAIVWLACGADHPQEDVMDKLDHTIQLTNAIQELCEASARIAVIDAQERNPVRNQERAAQVCRQEHARGKVTGHMIQLMEIL